MNFVNMWVVSPDDPLYQTALAEEEMAWGRERSYSPQDHPLRQAYQNEVITGDPNKDVIEWFIENFGPFKSCCSLGCGTGRIERRFLAAQGCDQLWVCDLSKSALEKFIAEAPGNVSFKVLDLNFAELPENAFDLIIAWESLHHLVNLEHVLYQIACALKSDGLFLVRDFIGETRWQLSNTKRKN